MVFTVKLSGMKVDLLVVALYSQQTYRPVFRLARVFKALAECVTGYSFGDWIHAFEQSDILYLL
jgi:hypothetical protein